MLKRKVRIRKIRGWIALHELPLSRHPAEITIRGWTGKGFHDLRCILLIEEPVERKRKHG